MDINALTTLFAAFIGAYLAFKLNEDTERRCQKSANRAALNRALFICSRQQNAIHNLQRLLAPYKSDLERAFNLPAQEPPQYSDLRQNFEALEFMLESGGENLLMELTVEQERFEQAMKALRMRNDLYVTEVQPLLSSGRVHGRSVEIEELKRLLGERLFEASLMGSKAIYFHVDESMKSLSEIDGKLFVFAKKMFPKEKFIRWRLPQE